jgi:hypothetical protein
MSTTKETLEKLKRDQLNYLCGLRIRMGGLFEQEKPKVKLTGSAGPR